MCKCPILMILLVVVIFPGLLWPTQNNNTKHPAVTTQAYKLFYRKQVRLTNLLGSVKLRNAFRRLTFLNRTKDWSQLSLTHDNACKNTFTWGKRRIPSQRRYSNQRALQIASITKLPTELRVRRPYATSQLLQFQFVARTRFVSFIGARFDTQTLQVDSNSAIIMFSFLVLA